MKTYRLVSTSWARARSDQDDQLLFDLLGVDFASSHEHTKFGRTNQIEGNKLSANQIEENKLSANQVAED